MNNNELFKEYPLAFVGLALMMAGAIYLVMNGLRASPDVWMILFLPGALLYAVTKPTGEARILMVPFVGLLVLNTIILSWVVLSLILNN